MRPQPRFPRLSRNGRAAARLVLLAALLTLPWALGSCERKSGIARAFPENLTGETACNLDGMLLMSHPGPKGQVLLKDGTILFYCDAKELFEALHDPDRAHRIAKAFVQPMDGRAWGAYADGWEEVGALVFVLGSRRGGSMGPTIVPFRGEEAAQAFVAEQGGRVVPPAGLTAEAVAAYVREARETLRRSGVPMEHGGAKASDRMESGAMKEHGR